MSFLASRRWFVAALAVAALALGACTSQDASREDVVDALTEADASDEQADCVGDGLEDQLSQSELNDVAKASTLSDIDDEEVRTQVETVMTECFTGDGGEAPADDETDSTDTTGGETGDTTETTAATTTTAPPAGG